MNLLILYANFEDKPVTLTIGEVIAEANVCSLGTKVKQKINSVTKQVNPANSIKGRDLSKSFSPFAIFAMSRFHKVLWNLSA